jgi:hypothetical protein
MKKLFLLTCSLLLIPFSDIIAMQQPPKTCDEACQTEECKEDEGWDLGNVDRKICLLGGRFELELGADCTEDADFNSIFPIYKGSLDNKKFMVSFSLQKKAQTVLVNWTTYELVITVEPTPSGPETTIRDLIRHGSYRMSNVTRKNFFVTCVTAFAGSYLVRIAERKILNDKCSKCQLKIAELTQTGNIFVAPHRYLTCGDMLCKKCAAQWDKEQPKNVCNCPVCDRELFAPTDCLDATEITVPAN